MRDGNRLKNRKFNLKSLGVVTLLNCTILLSTVTAQESINVTSNNVSGTGGSLSYSIGQLVYTTVTGTKGIAAQGVQLPFEIYAITAIDGVKDINLKVSVFQNLTTNNLILNVTDFDVTKLTYQIFDVNGKLLETKKLNSNPTYIDMYKFFPAVYFVKVITENKEIKIFKVIKN